MREMRSKDLYRRIGLQIYKARIAKKLSQSKLAEIVEISREFVSRLENGNQSATIDTYYRITRALGISLCELFNANEDNHKINDLNHLLIDCSKAETRALVEILRVVKTQYQSLLI